MICLGKLHDGLYSLSAMARMQPQHLLSHLLPVLPPFINYTVQ